MARPRIKSLSELMIDSPTGGHGLAITDAVLAEVIERVARARKIHPSEIPFNPHVKQYRPLAHARQEVMWRLRDMKAADGRPKYGFPNIARAVNLADHTTAIYGCEKHEERMVEGE